MAKKWIVAEKKSNNLIEQLLANRKIKKEEQSSFLNPDFQKGLHDPFLMKGMKEAVARIEAAILKKETVGVFGDYDADGIPGLALLYEVLTKLGLNVVPYIPSRSEGYGLNKEGIDFFIKENVTLMVTVDLGIRSLEKVQYAKDHGINVIVTDHHEPGDKIPDCIIVNPKQKLDKYPFRELSGCGVAFKLTQGLSKSNKVLSLNYLKWLMDLVAIATICDIVPLVDENRIFAKFGLIVLRKTRRIGLQKLYLVAGLDPEKIDTYTVGFQIGPRLNAPGRMDHANQSFYLLTSVDEKKAAELAGSLDQINRRRQLELERVLKEAEEKVIEDGLNKNKVILVTGENWPHGIIGLVAGRLMEEYGRPVIVCEKRENDYRGSARSIDAYNIVEALEASKEYLTSYGGHAKAAGLIFEHKNIKDFYKRLLKIADEKLKDEDLVSKLKIDANIKSNEINQDLYDNLEKFEPFGLGNPRPVFAINEAEISETKLVGQDNKHLKLKINGIDAIGFDFGSLAQSINDSEAQVAFTLDENVWNNTTNLQLKILDIKQNNEKSTI